MTGIQTEMFDCFSTRCAAGMDFHSRSERFVFMAFNQLLNDVKWRPAKRPINTPANGRIRCYLTL